ncbi:Pentatricopeptide repeat-containing protein, chloroplastic [Sphaceloma murrayae]|uniref:Pentatricopeptide repeat-containing protein, chloroplastic n=1 Tax=Sphaceloma murrayae TaxID=2082308 RepID=A0A2K1QJE7_9PEZI|nr:Pentatricopeptide repeat-containing protein, chloroplastic [Sphaceloma murrayae]
MALIRREDMIGMPTPLFVLLIMIAGGFFVLMCAAFHRFLGTHEDRDPQARTPEQDGYMREVRQRSYNDLSYGRRPLREPIDTSQRQSSGQY